TTSSVCGTLSPAAEHRTIKQYHYHANLGLLSLSLVWLEGEDQSAKNHDKKPSTKNVVHIFFAVILLRRFFIIYLCSKVNSCLNLPSQCQWHASALKVVLCVKR
ncbi:hypothetical protein, partial [Chromobacterium haemolyticum]|uniref:hypothetical protein n=1 Tax=Chromobacterium haemolyticum TaxID=394935 RepID=UPI001C4E2DFD